MFALFLKGFIIGIAIAAPVGPISMLCIQRTLHNGFMIGIMTGLGAAAADGVYGIIAGFGLTAVSSLLVAQQFWIRLIGGLFLIYLGAKLLLTPYHAPSATNKPDKSAWHAFATTFFLTLTNPMTILSFIAIFAGLGLGSSETNYLSAIALVIGIVLGSACWQLSLSASVAFILHHRINTHTMRLINRLSGVVMLLFGVFALKQ